MGQEGIDSSRPWHVYATPYTPHLSPILSLGIYLFSHPGILEPSNPLFPAQYQYNRYADILGKVVGSNKEEFGRLGVDIGTLGTHSARKGAATFAASGCTISPSMASICNRAGWKMGDTRDKYIKYEAAGDQFLGRTVCGTSSLTKEFAHSPPFFDSSPQEQTHIDEYIKKHLVGGRDIDEKLFAVVRMCFASVCYHHEYLQKHLAPTHRYRSNTLFINIPRVRYFFVFHVHDQVTNFNCYFILSLYYRQFKREQSFFQTTNALLLLARPTLQVFHLMLLFLTTYPT